MSNTTTSRPPHGGSCSKTLGGLDGSFLQGDRAVTDDRHIADGYRMLATTLGVAFDIYLFADPSRPRWVELNTPSRPDRRWGGDNTDAYYFMCPVDPKRRYRISGNKGDSQVPDANFGWSARDACYAYGSFVLEDDEALVITHRPPPCRFWNLVVWNQFMATPGVSDARSSVNGHSAVSNADGTVTVVLSRGMTAHPNSLTTLDYPLGNLAFGWFLADDVPARPEVRLVKVSDAPTSVD
jgi:hypothetical protein